MIAAYVVCLALFCVTADQIISTAAADCGYLVRVATGNRYDHGTKSRVAIRVYGTDGTCPWRTLTSRGFRPGSIVEITITCPCFGQVRRLVIHHKHDGWFLSYIEIKNPFVYSFPCYSKLTSDYKYLYKSYCKYQVGTVTSHKSFAGTHARVYIRMRGSVAVSRWIRLYHTVKTPFMRGKKDYFDISSRCVGYPRSLGIRRDNNGPSPSWHLSTISIRHIVPRRRRPTKWAEFRVHKWVPKETTVSPAYTRYKVVVYTGSMSGAGTDAKVTITFQNSYAHTRAIILNSRSFELERGRKDWFHVRGKSIGYVDKIFVRHNNAGYKPDWYIEKIQVNNRFTEEWFTCPCNKWLQGSKPYSWFRCYEN